MTNPYAMDLVQFSTNNSVTGADFKQSLQVFVNSLKEAQRGEANEAVSILAPGLTSQNLSRASHIAKICDSMIRSGCPWESIIEPMTTGLHRCLRKAKPVLETLQKNLQTDPVNEEAYQEEIELLLEKGLPAIGKADPKSYGAWVALGRYSSLAHTVLALDPKARSVVKSKLEEIISPFAKWIPCLGKLTEIFGILEKEPIVVIDVDGHKGFIGTFGGAATNSQLLILVMDTLPNMEVFPKEYVERELVESAKGIGPMDIGKKFYGRWNHYTFRALRSNGKLPDPKDFTANKEWIWMEKIPSEIPTLDGHRIILLGPPSYERSWEFIRNHELVSSQIEVESELSRGDIDYWMKKIMTNLYGQN